mgnify:FL=1
MKFIYRITIGLSVLMFIFLTVWGIFFFRSMVAEVNDETDDMLEAYSADIILRWISGMEIPSVDNGSNNTYYIKSVPEEQVAGMPRISYENSMIYIASKGETEAARIRHQIFMDGENEYYELTVAVPTFERQDLFRAILKWIVFLYIILLAGGIGITIVVVEYNFKPLRALLKWFDSYIPGKKNPPVPCDDSIEEFRILSVATQNAADRIEKQYELQNQFIGNASHELQTPLAVCSGKIEMMLDSDEELSAQQAEDLMQVHRKLQGMIRLNKTLLLMTKIDNGQFIDVSEIDLSAIMRDSVSMLDDIYSAKGVSSEVEVEDNVRIRMNEQLCSVLFTNLLKNAYMHSPSGSVVNVRLSAKSLVVSNDGDTPLDKLRIFDRFYQGRGRKEGSSGLGLALVKSVCGRYSFGLDYEYDGRHNFTVIF